MDTTSKTGAAGIITKCEGCDKAYRIHPEKIPDGVTSFPCRACSTLIQLGGVPIGESEDGTGEKILIVVEEEELGRLIQRILKASGYPGDLATTGEEGLGLVHGGDYKLLLISVYLPDMMGYEFLDRFAGERSGQGIPSILLSAVHHAARYKRAPTSLYGADDYLERHHLPDLLVPKIRRLLAPAKENMPEVTPDTLPAPSDDQVRARRDLESVETGTPVPDDPKMDEVKRMCRVIAGDIALYNEDIISSSSPEALLDALASDLTDGESLLMNRFPEMEDQLSHLLRGEMVRLLHLRGIQLSGNSGK